MTKLSGIRFAHKLAYYRLHNQCYLGAKFVNVSLKFILMMHESRFAGKMNKTVRMSQWCYFFFCNCEKLENVVALRREVI